ncbi:uncharacterized protein LOC125383619 [Haliotis rufescens]|uniref:uncharacterized protein LOC125383619 n=1 Tax=Haliotis rufescens TaxID=6454 RepID=UPI00201FACE3|nr:uncharacterized protein LOC125383619 [Haliotis rufescens]
MDNYANLLDKVSRIRYHEKTGVIDKEDPYRIPKSKWSDDHKHLPATNYIDIVNYLVFSPSPFCSLSDIRNYRSLEAYDRFVCGWVRDIVSYVHLSVEDGKAIHVVKSKVMHSQRLNEAPLHPWFITDDTGKVLSAHCNCIAGLGESCTHVASVMFAVKAIVRLREKEEVTTVEAATRNQAGSPLWFQFRAGRITASKMKSASRTSLLDPSRSLLRHICYPNEVKFSHPATRWGCSHEVTARDAYEKLSCEHHHNFSVEECGLFLSCEYPHLGATPDGIVDCSCCGRGCLEIKCPYCVKDD